MNATLLESKLDQITMVPYADVRHVSANETAKLVRAILKRRNPNLKIGVRMNRYAGGVSIDISVPKHVGDATLKFISETVEPFCGTGFDGMIDLSFYKDSWLNFDGSASKGQCGGTTGSKGTVEPYAHPQPFASSEMVHFGVSHISVQRDWRS